MPFQLYTVNHLTHEIPQIAAAADFAHFHESRWRDVPGVHSLVTLITCNRVEIYVSAAPQVRLLPVFPGDPFENHSTSVDSVNPANPAGSANPTNPANPAGSCPAFATPTTRTTPVTPSSDSPLTWNYLEGREVAEHLFRVASGLDSMVVGEAEVAGQVRRAFTRALEQGMVKGLMVKMFEGALATSRRVATHTELTGLGRSVVSVALDLAAAQLPSFPLSSTPTASPKTTSAAPLSPIPLVETIPTPCANSVPVQTPTTTPASNPASNSATTPASTPASNGTPEKLRGNQQSSVDLVDENRGVSVAWPQVKALLVGTGAYAGATVAQLRARGVKDIANIQTSQRVVPFSAIHHTRVIKPQDTIPALHAADLVIACRGVGSPVLSRRQVASALEGRQRPLIILDLALHADVEPSVSELPGVRLWNLEDIRSHVPALAVSQIQRANELVEEGLADYDAAVAARHMDPVVVQLRSLFEQAAQEEIASLPPGETITRQDAEKAIWHVVKKLAHTPSVSAHLAAESGLGAQWVNALATVWGLTPEVLEDAFTG